MIFRPSDNSMQCKFVSARAAIPAKSFDLRKLHFETESSLECVPHLHVPVFPSNMPMFFQLPVDLDEIETVPLPACLTARRYSQRPRALNELMAFFESQFHNPRVKSQEGENYLMISKNSEHEKVQVSMCRQESDSAKTKASFDQILMEICQGAFDIVERQQKQNSEQSAQEIFAIQDVRAVFKKQSDGRRSLALKFPCASVQGKGVVSRTLRHLCGADTVSCGVDLVRDRYKEDREALFDIAKDWSLNSCGGYADDFDPLSRPNCDLGRYGRIFPTYHLTNDAGDFDSGVRLDIIHREHGSFMELHSFEGRSKIEEAAEIFAKSIPGFNTNLQWWDGKPEERWLD